MAEIVMKVPAYRCERCQYEWISRGPRLENRPKGATEEDLKPRICPRCKSPYWATPRKPPAHPKAK
jgi:rubredoxin